MSGMGEAQFQAGGPLSIIEETDAYLVVLADDNADWVARFEKGTAFPAKAWAENMVEVYNRRLERGLSSLRMSAP